jgi:hypothetical protein
VEAQQQRVRPTLRLKGRAHQAPKPRSVKIYMSLFSSRTRSSASPKTDLGSTIDSQVLTPGLAPEGLGQGTRAASTMTAMPGAGIAAQLAPSRVIDTAAPIDAAPQKTASIRISLIWESQMSHSYGPLVLVDAGSKADSPLIVERLPKSSTQNRPKKPRRPRIPACPACIT